MGRPGSGTPGGIDDGTDAFEQASTLDAAGREAEAIPLYELAVASGLPERLEYQSLVQLGSSLRVVGRADDAVAVHRGVCHRWPDRVANRLFLALALLAADQPAQAVGEAVAAALLTEGNPDVDDYRRALSSYASPPQSPR